jgi:hypothetical protein
VDRRCNKCAGIIGGRITSLPCALQKSTRQTSLCRVPSNKAHGKEFVLIILKVRGKYLQCGGKTVCRAWHFMHTANVLRHTEPLNRPPTWDQTPVCRGLELCRELLSDFAVCCVLPWVSVAVCRESYFRRVLRFYLPWADILPWAKVYGSRYKYQCRGSTHGKRSAHGKGGFSGSVRKWILV